MIPKLLAVDQELIFDSGSIVILGNIGKASITQSRKSHPETFNDRIEYLNK